MIEAAAWMIFWAAVGMSIMTLFLKWISVGTPFLGPSYHPFRVRSFAWSGPLIVTAGKQVSRTLIIKGG
jgi:hypothetical protein